MAMLEVNENGRLREVKLTKPVIFIGRDEDNDIVVEDAKCSRKHCQIEIRDGQLVLVDLTSRNGTWSNSTRIQEMHLTDGDEFRIGHSSFRLRAEAPVQGVKAARQEAPIETIPFAADDRAAAPAAPTATLQPAFKPSRPSAPRSKMDWAERVYYIQLILKTLAVVILVGGVTGIFWYRSYSASEASRAQTATEREQTAKEEKRQQDAKEGAQKDLEGLLAAGKYADAKQRLDFWRGQGLPEDFASRKGLEIETRLREAGGALVKDALVAVEAKDLAKAEGLMDQLRPLQAAGFTDDHIGKLEVAMNQLRDSAKQEQNSKEREQATDTLFLRLAEGKYEEAIVLRKRVLDGIADQQERELVERRIRDKVGALVRFRHAPPGAEIKILGHGEIKVRCDEIVPGLPDGPLTATITCDGYLSETVTKDIAYPNLTDVPVKMIEIAPPALWAAQAFSGRKEGVFVYYYYEKTLKNSMRKQYEALLFPKAEGLLVGGSQQPLNKDKLKGEIEKLSKDSPSDALLLRRLAELAAKTGNSLGLIYEAEQDLIAKVVKQAERGCFDCVGVGKVFCPTCDGVGKGRFLQSCKAPGCDGGYVKCGKCNGAGDVQCDKCKGNGYQDAAKTKLCPVCGFTQVEHKPTRKGGGKIKAFGGRGRTTCPACQGEGEKECPLCLGEAKREVANSNCEDCRGTRFVMCQTCEGKATRDRMKPDVRREKESLLEKLRSEHPVP